LKTDHLTAKHLCHHIHIGLTPEHLTRIRTEDEYTPILAIPFEVTWKATWLSEAIVRSLPNGNSAVHNYRISKPALRKKTMTALPTPPPRLCGWHPQYTTYTTHPIIPDLDAVPTGSFVIASHTTSLDSVILHAPDGRLISPILKARLHKLTKIYRPPKSTTTLPEAIAGAILRHKATTYKESFTNKRKLHRQQKTIAITRI
jgi:hypothetical protein